MNKKNVHKIPYEDIYMSLFVQTDNFPIRNLAKISGFQEN